MTQSIQLRGISEKQAIGFADGCDNICMVTLEGPVMPADQGDTRAAQRMCAVVDRSGSMSGAKIKLMQETLRFMIQQGLVAQDWFSIVSYDNRVYTSLDWTRMDGEGKQKALEAVDQLRPGGSTNLSGGLLQGMHMVKSKVEEQGTGGAASVLLFTDGMANNGIQDTQGIVAAMGGLMTEGSSVFTFGFGADHNEDMLRGIADQGKGIYYFIENNDSIPTAFADCLGGLVSVVAQNISVELQALAGTRLKEIKSGFDSQLQPDGQSASLQMGDLYAEEARDLLVLTQLPVLGTAASDPCETVRATIRYFNVLASTMEEVSALITVARPAQTPSNQQVNPKVDAQRNRIMAAEAIQKAAELADAGHLTAGRQMLQQMCDTISYTPSAQAQDSLSLNLISEMQEMDAGYANQQDYENWGSKMSKMRMKSHQMQRCTHAGGATYDTASKKTMKLQMLKARKTTSERPPAVPEPQRGPVPAPANTWRAPQVQRQLSPLDLNSQAQAPEQQPKKPESWVRRLSGMLTSRGSARS